MWITHSGGFQKPYSLSFSHRSRCFLGWGRVTSSILWVVSKIRCLEKLDNMKEYWNISWIRPLHYSCIINSQNIKGTFLNIGPYSVKEIQNSLLRLNHDAKCSISWADPLRKGRQETKVGLLVQKGLIWLSRGALDFLVHVLLAQNCNISLFMLILLDSYVGFSVVTADRFHAVFSIPCITKTTTNFACKPEFEENAALVLMVLGWQLRAFAQAFSVCHSSEILLFSGLRTALALSLHSLLLC